MWLKFPNKQTHAWNRKQYMKMQEPEENQVKV